MTRLMQPIQPEDAVFCERLRCMCITSLREQALQRPLVWIISDKSGVRQTLFRELEFDTVSMHHDLHSRAHYNTLVSTLKVYKPCLLWVRLAGPCSGSGNKRDASRTSHLCALIQAQQALGGSVLIEANARSLSWNMVPVQGLIDGMTVTRHSWCRHEPSSSTNFVPCNSVFQLATNFPMSSMPCMCPDGTKHIDVKSMLDGRDDRMKGALRSLVKLAWVSMSPSHSHRQPELNNLSSVELARETFAATPAILNDAVLTLEQAESMARDFRLRQDFSWVSCYRVLRSTPFRLVNDPREAIVTVNGRASCFVFGVFSYGAFAGVTKSTQQHVELVRYINCCLLHRDRELRWSSISLNHNSAMHPHRDVNNLKGSCNIVVGLGDYESGGVWIQVDASAADAPGVKWLDVKGQRVPGVVHDCRHRIVKFSPDLFHQPMAWTGDRWTINAYSSRGILNITDDEFRDLSRLRFPIGTSQTELREIKTVTFQQDVDHCIDSFPTQQAINRKAVLSAGHTPVKKKRIVEQHADDCGDSLDSILAVTETTLWSPELMGLGSATELCDENSTIFSGLSDFAYGRGRWLHGSNSIGFMPRLSARPVLSLDALSAFHARISPAIAVVEVFSGQDNSAYMVSKLHNPSTGDNFDLSASFDVTSGANVRQMLQYVTNNKPLFVVMTPNCNLDQTTGVRFANLCVEVARSQCSQGHHFLIEQPVDSPLHHLIEFQYLCREYPLHQCRFDLCMTGLCAKKPPCLPIQKPTMVCASDSRFTRLLQYFVCDARHEHTDFEARSASHVWPVLLCRLVAAGIADIAHEHVQAGLVGTRRAHLTSSKQVYVECLGCKHHRRKDDPTHTRDATCKYPDVEPFEWSCPACKHHMPRTHPIDHTCRWTVANRLPEGLSRERKGSHPRDGRVPAASEETADTRIADLGPIGGNASSSSREPRPREAESASSEPLRSRSAPSRPGPAGPGRRNAAAQASDGGLGVDGDGAAARIIRNPPEPDGGGAVNAEAPGDDTGADEVWSRFDVGRAMQELRSSQPGVLRRALRRLHLRWFHAPTARMESLLQAAGIPADVVKLARQVVDTCSVCRTWSTPSPKTVTTSSLPTRFNQTLQMDLLFIKDKIVLHVLDVCTRFTMAEEVANRNTDELLSTLQKTWFKMFGPPRVIVIDQEGGLSGPEAAAWFEARDVTLELRAKNQHADMAERHNEVLRRQIHLLDTNATKEGLRVSFGALLAEAVFAKNILFNMGGASPYEAVFGRIPPLITVVSHESPDFIDDRDADRLRHLAIQSMTQASAEMKARRANATKTRRAGELLGLEAGDLVDFWRRASSKDLECWPWLRT